jgi:serine/threonine protein kinase
VQCIHCKGENNENARFCRHCGNPLYDVQFTSSKLPLGTELDNRYKIIDYIAKGGMGAVYKAVDLKVAGIWAVKEMLDYFDSEGEREYAIERFATEAQILYDLDHPSIPRFIDCFVADNRYYLIMEFIDGVDLRKMLEDYQSDGRQGLDENDVVRWGSQLANVLHYLHTQDPPIVYRDLKPGNIMVTADDKVYLIDFGIARLFDPRTKGTMVGTQGYAPPEQYRGEAEPRSDIYSLAACMHHLLTGKDPRNDIPFNFPPVRSIRHDLSEKVEATLDKALAMEPADRFATAQEMGLSLKAGAKELLEDSEDGVDIGEEMEEMGYARTKPEKVLGIKEIFREDTEYYAKSAETKHMSREEMEFFESGAGKLSFWYTFRSDRRHSGRSPYGRDIQGKYRWSFNTGAPIRSSPVLAGNGSIYIGADNGILYVLNPDGRENWNFRTRASILSSPTLDREGNVYIGSNDCHLYALNPNGKMLWRFKTFGRIRSSPCIGLDRCVYIGSYDHYLYCINPDGSMKWRIDLGGKLESTPALSEDGFLYVACRGTLEEDSFFYCLDTAGNIRWYQELGGPSLSSPTISRNKNVYIGDSDGYLYSFNKGGSVRWKFKTRGPIHSSPVADEGKSIYFGSMDGNFYNISSKGKLKWRFKTKSSITSSPAMSGTGAIFFGSDDYYVYAFSPDGDMQWKFKCGGRVRSSPAIGEGDVLYTGCDDGYIYAIE